MKESVIFHDSYKYMYAVGDSVDSGKGFFDKEFVWQKCFIDNYLNVANQSTVF